jgi:predicted ATPase
LRLRIRNYKSIAQADLELRPGLNILIGPNGSGKTCMLSCLKFLRDAFRLGGAQALARQGGARRVYRHGADSMSFSLSHPYRDRTYRRSRSKCSLTWSMTVKQTAADSVATISSEELKIVVEDLDEKPLLFSVLLSRKGPAQKPNPRIELPAVSDFGRDLFGFWGIEYSGLPKARIAEEFPKHVKRLLSGALEEPDRSLLPALASLDPVLAEVVETFNLLNEYNILPDVARASSEQLPFAQMAPNGAAVSLVIDALENERYHRLERSQWLDMDDEPRYWRRYSPYNTYFGYSRRKSSTVSLPEALDNINRELAAAVSPITHVAVATDPTNGKRFVIFKSGEEAFYPEEVSDGTVKWLCLLVSLFVPFSKVYLLEEPENFLHPWMQQRLIAIMRNQAKENKTIFFVSSHSATILNGAHPDEILVVTNGENGTELAAIQDIEEVRKALQDADFHLGDLWVSGAIGGVPANG